MAQPSQQFPPWLTPSLSVITDAAGVPVATSTDIVYLPLTYFGPSVSIIPLGSLWVFGGSTSPASLPTTSETTTSSATSLLPPITTSAIPTTSSVLPTASSATPTTTLSPPVPTSAIPTSATSIVTPPLTTSFSSTSTLTTTSAVPTSTITSNALTGGLTRGQLVGVIVASILGLIFLFVLALFLYLFCKGRRNRRQYDSPSPVDDEYYFVPPGGRTPGEGSPRHSGEEADPFLQRRGESSTAGPSTSANMAQIPGEMGSRPSGARVPVPTGGSQSSGSTNSNASGFGNVLERPTLGFMPSMPEDQMYPRGPLTVGEMAQLGYEGVQPDENQPPEAEYTGAYAYATDPFNQPPRLVNTSSSYTGLKPVRSGDEGFKSNRSSYNAIVDAEESATLLTATRVKMGRADPQIHDSSSSAGTSSLLASLGTGLSSLANIGRKSWFKGLDSPRHSYHNPQYAADPLSERDIETGRSMLSSAQVDSLGNRLRPEAVGTGPDGVRPTSNISARSAASGATIYHDAHSSAPGTPLLTPLPRAMTPAEQPVPMIPAEHAWISSPLAAGAPSSPPAYEDQFVIGSPSPSSPARSPPSLSSPLGADILDMPAPVAINNFSSLSSIKDTPTGSSAGVGSLFKTTPFPPPGLETVRPIGWSEVVTVAEPEEAHGVGNMFHSHSGITIDVLEEEPPAAEEGWRSMASSTTSGAGLTGGDLARRGTFGVLPSHPAFMSEQGSLHSMRSHFNPSMRSTGSAAASRRELTNGSLSSNSSRPSHHSSASAHSHTLSRTGSIPNENRRNLRVGGTSGNVSPALSAFGQHHFAPQMRASTSVADSAVAGLESPASVHVSSHKSGTLRSVGSSSMGSATAMDRSFGTLREEDGMPWAGGLDDEWRPTA
ncbi:hypothetical protein CVT24_005688 [Panaeolus cyanescens]|uniref:Uncharacterized protein n=1 Tax=Panaeolus cyanescens TaxID=181874 RepID=A0A409V990_9AGAR|nr:hypothetical protein CVT24_005688 [Panaeolus cyanescens]